MLQKNEKRAGTLRAMLAIMVLLLLVIVLENISAWIPGMPAIFSPTSQLFTVLKKGAVYSLVAVSMNLLNGFTGLFSLGQAGFMLLGAYAYAVLCIPVAKRAGVYQQFEGGLIQFSLPETFANLFGEGAGTVVGILIALLIGGLIAALMAYLIGLPVLRLKSDYLAIATLGFAEILRAFFQWNALGPITNGSNLLKGYPDFGHAWAYLILIAIFIGIILLMVSSTYGRLQGHPRR